MAAMNGAELRGLLTDAKRSVFRLEVLQQYLVPQETQRFRAFREGRPLPRREPGGLGLVAELVAGGRRTYRAHVVEHPLSEYVQFELLSYLESQEAGDEIYIVDRDAHPGLAALDRCRGQRDLALAHAVPLDEYLAARST